MVAKRGPTGVRPKGDGIQIRLWKNGKEIYSEILKGDYHNKSDLAAAVKRREHLKSRLDLGLPIRNEEESQVSLFGDQAQEWLNLLGADYSTHLSYEGILNKYWLPKFANWITEEITTKAIKSRLAEFPDISIKTQKNVLIPLRGVLDYAEVSPNPARYKISSRHQKPKVERFKPKERDLLMTEIINRGDPQVIAYFSLFFGTGMRPGELLGLEHVDYNSDAHTFYIHKQIVRRKFKPSTKTHEVREVYVPTWVRPHIDSLPSRWDGGHLFLNTKGTPHLDTDYFNGAWQDVFESHTIKRKHKIRYRIPYTCRHTRAAELLSNDVVPAKAARELGHTTEMFFRIYSEWIEEFQGESQIDKLEGSPVMNRSKQGGGR